GLACRGPTQSCFGLVGWSVRYRRGQRAVATSWLNRRWLCFTWNDGWLYFAACCFKIAGATGGWPGPAGCLY
ncbi:MAG: hypothetical protein WBH50_24045, partial [Fuerstiella sp.]